MNKKHKYAVWIVYHDAEGKQSDMHDFDDFDEAFLFAKNNVRPSVIVSIYDNQERKKMLDLLKETKCTTRMK